MGRKASEENQSKWKENILEQRQSNLSVVAWCLQNKIAVPTFHYWKKKLFPKSFDRNVFTEIVRDNNIGSGVSLEYRGIHIHLNRDFEPSVLQVCLDVLKKC